MPALPGRALAWLPLAALALACTPDGAGRGDTPGGRDAGVLLDAERTDVSGAACRLNSDCIPGLYCAEGRCSFDCRVDRDCPRGTTCQSGECLSDDPPDVGRPDRDRGIPVLDAEVDGGDDPIRDAMVTPPRDAMTPPARDAIAPPPDAMIGPMPQNLPLGADCQRASACASDLCVDLAINGRAYAVCASPCCAETDCPVGFGCQFFRGVKLCVPSRIYPAGYTFDRAAGQTCAGNGCQSGLCDVGRDRCLAACCTDADCNGLTCVWTPTGGGPRAICEILPFGDGRTGDGCFGDLDCQSRVCVPYANAPGGAPGVCADPCCTHEDCFGGNTCGRVAAFEGATPTGVISACVPVPRGPLPDGDPCQHESQCAGTECIEGECTRPCCADADCALGRRCLPRPTPEGIFARVCVVPDE